LSPSSENKIKKLMGYRRSMISSIPVFGRAFAKDNFKKTIEEALNRRISQAVE
jgi:hypothetical protein